MNVYTYQAVTMPTMLLVCCNALWQRAIKLSSVTQLHGCIKSLIFVLPDIATPCTVCVCRSYLHLQHFLMNRKSGERLFWSENYKKPRMLFFVDDLSSFSIQRWVKMVRLSIWHAKPKQIVKSPEITPPLSLLWGITHNFSPSFLYPQACF